MFDATIQLRVRYAETDQMGFVYYGNYAMYYEVARVEALRQMGYTYREIEEEGFLMPVLENYSKFLQPARYDDLLQVRVWIPELPGIKTIFQYSFHLEDGTCIHEGKTILTFLKKENLRPCRPPAKLMSILRPLYA
jgi:acyl-CoA thioester hydrolase